MQSVTWPGQLHRDHVVDSDENSFLTGWRLGCPNCGEMIAVSLSQSVQDISDINAAGRVYARILTTCNLCEHQLTELWSIN